MFKSKEWLEENWNNMCETVQTLTNNQIMQNESKNGNKKLLNMNLLTDNEAKVALRSSKGNIWQSIEKCVKNRQNIAKQSTRTNNNKSEPRQSFEMLISGAGSGKDNNDVNDILQPFQELETFGIKCLKSSETLFKIHLLYV